MSDTTAQPDPGYATDMLLAVIVTLLTPLFLAPAEGDVAMARMAALGTVNAFRVETRPTAQPKPQPQQAEQVSPATVWADALTNVAQEYAEEIANYPASDQPAVANRVQALTDLANQLHARESVELRRQPRIAPVREHPADMPGQRPP